MDPSKPVTRNLTPARFLLAVILFSAFLARFWGVWFGLPCLYHADEPIVVNHALAYGTGDLNPHFFNIPPLVSYLLFFCYGVYYLTGRLAGAFRGPQDFENLFYLDPSSFYWIARLVFGVLLGALTVLVLYRLARRCRNTGTALLAAALLAVNFLHARDSHYIYVDIPLVLVLLAGFLVFMGLPEKPRSWKWHALSGAAIGLAAAVKYNGVFLAIPYVWLCLRCVPPKRWLLSWFAAFCASAATFVLLNPFSVLDYGFFVKELAEQSAANAGGLPWSHHLAYSLSGAMGWPALVAGILGMFAALIRREPRMQAVAVFGVGYYLVLWRFGQPYDRYALPLVPVLCVFAADFLMVLRDRFFLKSRMRKILFAVLISGAVAPSLVKIVWWDHVMAAGDVRTIAKEWIESNIPAGSRLAMDEAFFMPRLAFSEGQLREKMKGLDPQGAQAAAKIRRLNQMLSTVRQPSYELYFLSRDPGGPQFLFGGPRIAFDPDELRRREIDYVILAGKPGDPERSLRALLEKSAERIAVFSPYRDGKVLGNFDSQVLTGGPFLWKDIAARERNGYPISVYRMRS